MFVEEKAKGEVKELDEIGRALLKASEIIARKGHCKGRAISANGSVCISGALSEAVDWDAKLHSRTFRKLHEMCGGNAIAWNDAPERTKEEVITKLREAAFSS